MTNKVYVVVKDGETLKEVKTLAAAKKLADTEGAAVYCDGRCVYGDAEEKSAPAAAEVPGPGGSAPENYVLTARMNIRKAPDMSAEKTGTAKKGTVVEATAVKDGWLCLTDGTFILYEDGRFARKI